MICFIYGIQIQYINEVYHISPYEYQQIKFQLPDKNIIECLEDLGGMYKCWCKYPNIHNGLFGPQCIMHDIQKGYSYQQPQFCTDFGCNGMCYKVKNDIICHGCNPNSIAIGSECYERTQNNCYINKTVICPSCIGQNCNSKQKISQKLIIKGYWSWLEQK